MTERFLVLRALLIAALALSVFACSRQSPSGPTQVTQTPTFSGEGFVGDTAFRAVIGARVEVLDGENAGVFAITDDQGKFTITTPDKFSAGFSVRVTKDGYVPATKMVACAVGCLVITLQSVAAAVDVMGTYTLTLVAADTCSAQLPDALRTRTYTVTISPTPLGGVPPGPFGAVVSGGLFLPDHNSLVVGVAGTYVAVGVVDDDYADGLVEQVAPAAYLNIVGGAHFSVETSGLSTISAPFDGRFGYCVSGTAPVSSFHSCWTDHPSSECASANHRLILARR